jgi:hypothetical protein
MDRLPDNLPREGDTFRRVEVITGVARRRRWTAEEKARIVAETRDCNHFENRLTHSSLMTQSWRPKDDALAA